MKRDEPGRGAAAGRGRMRPRVAEADAVELDPLRPDLLQRLQHRLENVGRVQTTLRRAAAKGVEEMGRTFHGSAEPLQQSHPPVEAGQRIRGRRLEAAGHPALLEVHQDRGVSPPGARRIAREEPGLEHPKARHGEALGARERLTGLLFPKAPRLPGAGVEQDTRDDQVDFCARALGRGQAAQRGPKRGDASHAAGVQMTPPAVIRNGESGIAPARDRRHEVGDLGQTARLDAEVRQPTAEAGRQNVGAALANRCRAAQVSDRAGPARRAHSSPRPLGLAGVPLSGTRPSVK